MQASEITDLHAMATRLHEIQTAQREKCMRVWHACALQEGQPVNKSFEAWRPSAVRLSTEVDFLIDNFKAGTAFELAGVACVSCGIGFDWQRGYQVLYMAKGDNGGLQERALPFAMAAAVVLGAPV